MSEYGLGLKLREMYDNAPKGELVMHIHLFGIKYADEIKDNRYSVKEIVKSAELQESYHAEVSKGIKLAKYVEMKRTSL